VIGFNWNDLLLISYPSHCCTFSRHRGSSPWHSCGNDEDATQAIHGIIMHAVASDVPLGQAVVRRVHKCFAYK
jgi:hypothetical protein